MDNEKKKFAVIVVNDKSGRGKRANVDKLKKTMLNNTKHLILEAPHPSPLSAYRGFFGSKPFSQTNAFLEAHGETPIDWQIELMEICVDKRI